MRLFEFELLWANAALGAVLPDHGPLPIGIGRMAPGRFLADIVASASFEHAVALRVALWLVALAPILLLRRPASIAAVAPAERERVMGRLLASPVYAVRQLVLALKATASLLYATSPDARRAMLGAPGVVREIPTAAESGVVSIRVQRRRGSRAA